MMLRPYLAVVDARFRMLLQYRAAAIAGVWTQIVFGLVLIMIYEAFYRSSTAAEQPMTFAHLASYVWLGQAFLAMLPWNADPEIKAMVRSGAVAYELCRPVDLYGLWYARTVAHRTAPTLLRCLPMAAFAMFVLPAFGQGDLALEPPEPAAGLVFAASLLTTIVLACAMAVLINITLLWTVAGEGIVMMASTVVALFSGILVPLPLFPDWAQNLLAWLPFAGLADQPFRIYTGVLPLEQVPLVLGRQLGWALLLIVFGRWLLSRGLRRIVVQGG